MCIVWSVFLPWNLMNFQITVHIPSACIICGFNKVANLGVLMDCTFTSAGNLGACWLPWWFTSALQTFISSGGLVKTHTPELQSWKWWCSNSGEGQDSCNGVWEPACSSSGETIVHILPNSMFGDVTWKTYTISQMAAFIPLQSVDSKNQDSPISCLPPRKLDVKRDEHAAGHITFQAARW